MDRSDTPTLLLPLLALLAFAFPFAMFRTPPSSGGTTTQASQSSEQVANKESEKLSTVSQPHSAARLIEDFLHAPEDRTIRPDSDPRKDYSLDFMVAIVADPIDSRLVRMFDSSIDSIQRAFEASGFELDRFDLAWSEAAAAKTDKKSASADGNASKPPRYQREPSLLLFRQPPDPNDDTSKGKLFLVFLVGETPTSGIHKAAMASALSQLSNFYWWGPRPNKFSGEFRNLANKDFDGTVKILGPTFSGSAPSLEFALRDWLDRINKQPSKADRPDIKFRIVSGSATAINPKEFCKIGTGGPQTFQAVVPPDKIAMPTIRAYIRSLGDGRAYTRIAMLTEASTAYGQASMPQEKASQKDTVPEIEKKDAPCTAESRENKTKSNQCAPGEEPEVIYLPFPMHISELRSASANQRRSQQNSASEVMINPGGALPLNEAQSSQPKEIPPSFSTLDAPSSELVLSGLLSTISHERVHAVGILATDVRDVLFLAREVHQHCPGTLVFTVFSDLLFSHPDVGASARGMLVFTPYPLYNLNQVWTPPYLGQGTRVQFPTQDAEGAYNATLALLCRKDLMLDYGEPFSPEDPGPYQQERKPALWVTVVGRHGPLPIQTLCWIDTEKYAVSIPGKPVNPQTANRKSVVPPPLGTETCPPSSAGKETHARPTLEADGFYTANTVIGIVLFSGVLIVLSWLIIFRCHTTDPPQQEKGSGGASKFFGEPVTPEYRRQVRLFLLASLVCLLAAYIVMAAIFSLPAIASLSLDTAPDLTFLLRRIVLTPSGIFIAAALLSLVAATVEVSYAFCVAPHQKRVLRVVVQIVVLAGCIFVLFFLAPRFAYGWVTKARTGNPGAFFTYDRAFQFFSGVSPLVPLFCVGLAGFLWAFCSFRRLRMIDGLRLEGGRASSEESLLALKTQSFDGLETLEAKVWERIEKASPFPTGGVCILIVVGLLAAAYLFFCPFVPSYEGRYFYFLYGWGFFLVYAALTTEFSRLCLAWGDFRCVLRRLALHPMQAAFGRYHESFPGLPRIDLSMSGQTFSVLEFSIDQAERLLPMARSLLLSWDLSQIQDRHLRAWIRLAERAVPEAGKKLSQALQADANGEWRLAIEERSECQAVLGKLTLKTAKLLEPTWRPTKKNPPFPGGKEFEDFRELGEEFLAGRVVLFISYVLPSLRKLGTFILIGLLLMLFSVMFYPFVQKNHLLAFNWVVILAFVGLALLVTLQMERDVVLSLLNGTKPGQVKVTRQFTFRILTYVMVPILLLLSAQFPDTIGQIVSWLGAFQGH